MKLYISIVLAVLVLSATAQTNVIQNTGNIGISTLSPGAKLSFNNVNDGSDGADGITWFNPNPLAYGIYRTSGTWIGPNYQQLRLSWDTGIILDPGVEYGKSFVEIRGKGLRVMSGNLGIGISNPTEKLSVNGNIRAKEIKVEVAGWPDFVFDKNFALPTLQSIEKYIDTYGHLEGIPTAAQVESQGVSLG
ncbi:MAG: hypothetical protein EOO89_18615, partial [Pedobacter sp.]